MNEDRFAFHFSRDAATRIQKFVSQRSGRMPPWLCALNMLFGVGIVTSEIIERQMPLAAFYLLNTVVWAMIWFRSGKAAGLAVEGDLRLATSGFVGTLDRSPVQIDWSDIATVSDIDDAIVIFRRKNLGPVAIPKSSIDDFANLWSVLEDRLVSKRNLIRSAAPRSQILNSAY